jgi:NAD+ kinase
MARFLFVPHHGRPQAGELALETIQWLDGLGHEIIVFENDANKTGLGRWAVNSLEGRRPDLAISLGGDGTMLRALDAVSQLGVPVLGVNIGHLGYLTEIEPGDLRGALDRYLAGDCKVVQRMTLDVEVITTTKAGVAIHGGTIAVNEVVIEKAAGSTVRLQASISNKPFLKYAVDGMIVATPTGSTAYNLSARGPIVAPSIEAILMTPVSAHMLCARAQPRRRAPFRGSRATRCVSGCRRTSIGKPARR